MRLATNSGARLAQIELGQLPLYIISMVFFLLALYRAFVLANAATVMSGPHIAVELVFIALSIFGVWFAHEKKQKAILK